VFFIPTGSTDAIDTCDVVLASETGPSSCTVSMLDGSVLRVAAPLASFVAEVDAMFPVTLPFMVGPVALGGGTVLGYLAANKIQRLQPGPDPLTQTLVVMLGAPNPVLVPAPIAFLAPALNNTSGGCGGGGPVITPNYVGGGVFSPNVTNVGASTFAENGPSVFLRVGPPGSTVPAPGDVLRASTRVFGDVPQSQGTFNFTVQSPAPIPNGGFQCSTNVRLISGGPIPLDGLLINRNGSDTFYVQAAIFPVDTTLMIDLTWAHVVDGV